MARPPTRPACRAAARARRRRRRPRARAARGRRGVRLHAALLGAPQVCPALSAGAGNASRGCPSAEQCCLFNMRIAGHPGRCARQPSGYSCLHHVLQRVCTGHVLTYHASLSWALQRVGTLCAGESRLPSVAGGTAAEKASNARAMASAAWVDARVKVCGFSTVYLCWCACPRSALRPRVVGLCNAYSCIINACSLLLWARSSAAKHAWLHTDLEAPRGVRRSARRRWWQRRAAWRPARRGRSSAGAPRA